MIDPGYTSIPPKSPGNVPVLTETPNAIRAMLVESIQYMVNKLAEDHNLVSKPLTVLCTSPEAHVDHINFHNTSIEFFDDVSGKIILLKWELIGNNKVVNLSTGFHGIDTVGMLKVIKLIWYWIGMNDVYKARLSSSPGLTKE